MSERRTIKIPEKVWRFCLFHERCGVSWERMPEVMKLANRVPAGPRGATWNLSLTRDELDNLLIDLEFYRIETSLAPEFRTDARNVGKFCDRLKEGWPR